MNFQKQLEFVNMVINEFSIGLDATRVGLVEFFTGASTEMHLDTYSDETALMQGVLQVPYR